LRKSTRLLATWDDHDYGRNNAGAEYPWKQAAKAAFMAFFDIADDAPVRQHPGVYSAHDIGPADSRIHIVLLDTRSFRGPLRETPPDRQCPDGGLVAVTDSSASLLGEQQWGWLEERLREPAALRLIVSSIQVIPDRHCYEKWGNFPRERTRLLKQVADSGVRTVFLSGDRHLGEISRLPAQSGAFPLYEITASGLNAAGAGRGEHNPYRVTPDNVRVDHFGVVSYRRTAATVELALHDTRGRPLQQYVLDYPTWLSESIAVPPP
jgi:alkaline phosphatase D